jgi:phosphoenolpyruvate carboxykinase (GTP)
MKIHHEGALQWVNACAALTKADDILWIDGSPEQLESLAVEAVACGELIKLSEELLPDCYYYRTKPTDVARDESRTYICSPTPEEAGPTNNWMDPVKMHAKLDALYAGCMSGRRMYVIPYCMCAIGSEFSKIGIEITDSIYVVLNMAIMTRVGAEVMEALGTEGDFVKCFHSKADINEKEKYIVHFPQEDTICSINSAYGGNVLLSKKSFALRIASSIGRREGWMAEHMLILCIQAPDGTKKYIAAAFPSACGKTNLAMLIPPEYYREKGYKVWTIGDDIAWLRVGSDGRLYAVNPENGFFGVAPGTNEKTNPNALASTKSHTIFTNVARNLDNNTVWWEGLDKNPPENGEDWLGRPWNGKASIDRGAHPNSRFTSPAGNCPSIAEEFFTGEGVPLSAIIFGGRRAKAEPLVYQTKDWNHGVFAGSIMASETTAAAKGQVGIVRHDPMAMLPFCGYNMGEYFQHWLDMGARLADPPKIFHVNWFRTREDGRFIWPGFRENMRVLMWILDRCDGKNPARDSFMGYLPYARDINIEGLEGVTIDTLQELLSLDREVWCREAQGIEEFYNKFDRLPSLL